MALHTIEICAGVGMLGEGLRAGLDHLGIPLRTVAYLEREAYPAACLGARCEEGSLDDAPVWSDLLTFDAASWRGAVDGIVAGFPCQDLSLAGRRAGLDGKRSGLFFNILDIADACGAWFLFLENVAGIASATASVVDEAEGALDERAAARVLGELADRGWNAEWTTLSASEVGASHGREQWFCWAWRELDDATSPRCDGARERPAADGEGGQCLSGAGCADMGHSKCPRRSQAGSGHEKHAGRELEPGCCQVGYPASQRRGEAGHSGAARGDAGTGGASASMAHPTRHGRHQGRPEPGREQGRPDAAERGGAMECEFCGYMFPEELGRYGCPNCEGEGLDGKPMADASRPRCEGLELGAALHGNRGGAQTHGPVEQLRRPLFAPGPTDARWADTIRQWPYLAPALESDFHTVVDGMAFDMGDSRAQRLKCCGNGVVALCAAAAAVVLVRRAKGRFA